MNIYSSPKKFGLELVADHDFGCSYEFDQVLLFKDGSGRFLVAHDSGCSCPIPFEDVSVDDLVEVRSPGDVEKFTREKVSSFALSDVELVDFMERVMAVMAR